MTPLWLFPLASIGLLAAPVLTAIYWLRRRSRTRPVSSLLLWLDAPEASEGGSRWKRLRTPFLFFLELLALLLLVAAAADPQLPRAAVGPPLVVVLDDSFSMLAGGADSPREQAVRALASELQRLPRRSVRFFLAGETPTALGDPVRSAAVAADLLSGWTCRSPASSLERAVSLAAQAGGADASILVLTDRAPAETPPEKGRVCWWAFGVARSNGAIVAAVRNQHDGGDRCLLEVANLGAERKLRTLKIELVDTGAEVRRFDLEMEPNEVRRLVLRLDEGTPAVRCRLSDDDLAIDNEVVLLPVTTRKMQVAVEVGDAVMRKATTRAVTAAGGVTPAVGAADLLISDAASPTAPANAWLVRLLRDEAAEAYTGPFVVDRTHPLADGLPLDGVVWGGGKSVESPGAPVVLAGGVPLLTDSEGPDGRHDVRLRWRADLSTLQDSPAWPVLMANLLRWRAANVPGASRPNLRLGEEAVVTLAGAVESARVVDSKGVGRAAVVRGNRVTAHCDDVGIHEVQAGTAKYRFAVNALSRDESDLGRCASGRWGDWLDESFVHEEYQEVGWVVLVGVLGVLALHLFLVARGGRQLA